MTRLKYRSPVRLMWADRRHWELDAWRLNVARWCPGAPCYLPGVRYARHWLTVTWWRRAWSARYQDERQPWSPHDL